MKNKKFQNGGLYKNVKISLKSLDFIISALLAALIFCIGAARK